MLRRVLLPAFAATLLTSTAHSETPLQKIEFRLGVSENGAPLEQVALSPTGGKVALPRGAWKCDYGTPEFADFDAPEWTGKLAVRCAMGAAVIRIETSCRHSRTARSSSDVLRDAQGVTLSIPNGRYSAFLSLSCQVKGSR